MLLITYHMYCEQNPKTDQVCS